MAQTYGPAALPELMFWWCSMLYGHCKSDTPQSAAWSLLHTVSSQAIVASAIVLATVILWVEEQSRGGWNRVEKEATMRGVLKEGNDGYWQ